MISFPMVMQTELLDALSKRGLTEQDHALQAPFLDTAHEPLRVGVQIRRLWRQLHRFHASLSQHSQELVGEERIAIMNQVALTLQDPVYRIRQIPADLAHPQSTWLWRRCRRSPPCA